MKLNQSPRALGLTLSTSLLEAIDQLEEITVERRKHHYKRNLLLQFLVKCLAIE